MQWDDKELDTQFTPNVYFWTPNSEILAKALYTVYATYFASLIFCESRLQDIFASG